MQELIKIEARTFGAGPVQAVNLRDLHAFLGSKRDFSNWAKSKLAESMAEEGVDYLVAKSGEQLPSGVKHKIDYYITLNTAKEIGMLERNPKGKEIRNYFIQAEERLRAQRPMGIPDTVFAMARAIISSKERGDAAHDLMRILAPSGTFGEMAKNGEPKTGFRASCFVASKARQKEARELNQKWGEWLQMTLDLCDANARLQ